MSPRWHVDIEMESASPIKRSRTFDHRCSLTGIEDLRWLLAWCHQTKINYTSKKTFNTIRELRDTRKYMLTKRLGRLARKRATLQVDAATEEWIRPTIGTHYLASSEVALISEWFSLSREQSTNGPGNVVSSFNISCKYMAWIIA